MCQKKEKETGNKQAIKEEGPRGKQRQGGKLHG